MIGRIAQGKYTRPEYSAMINPAQEHQLKTLALETLAKLVKSLLQFTQEHQAKVDDIIKAKKALSDEDKPDNDKDIEEKDIVVDTVNTEVLNKMDE